MNDLGKWNHVLMGCRWVSATYYYQSAPKGKSDILHLPEYFIVTGQAFPTTLSLPSDLPELSAAVAQIWELAT